MENKKAFSLNSYWKYYGRPLLLDFWFIPVICIKWLNKIDSIFDGYFLTMICILYLIHRTYELNQKYEVTHKGSMDAAKLDCVASTIETHQRGKYLNIIATLNQQRIWIYYSIIYFILMFVPAMPLSIAIVNHLNIPITLFGLFQMWVWLIATTFLSAFCFLICSNAKITNLQQIQLGCQ